MLASIPFEQLNDPKDIGTSAGKIMTLTTLAAAYEDILSPVPVRIQHILTSLVYTTSNISISRRCYTETPSYLQSAQFQTVFAGGFELPPPADPLQIHLLLYPPVSVPCYIDSNCHKQPLLVKVFADVEKGSLPYYLSAPNRERSSAYDPDRLKMSNYYYPPAEHPQEEDEFDFNQPYIAPTSQPPRFDPYITQPSATLPAQHQLFNDPRPLYESSQYQQAVDIDISQHPAWVTPVVPSNYHPTPYSDASFPAFSGAFDYGQNLVTAGPSSASVDYLSPEEAAQTRTSRATSFASNASSAPSLSQSDFSRSVSPSASEMAKWGYRNETRSWSCGYPGCASKSTFSRGCDLRKHYKRHTKTLFCRHEGCPQATSGGFSSKKDCARHEAKHNPKVACEWDGCDRLFSRVDNMKDHVRRVHRKQLAE
ncbi:hypothetical protein LTR29_017194 [Friedmanniomyces endolithicus]|nr:hypothetical protein LTR29_017194 [Friedmanniomyces endolithicus]